MLPPSATSETRVSDATLNPSDLSKSMGYNQKRDITRKDIFMIDLAPGLTAETSLTVTESDTAAKWGSGLVPVFGTPSLVGLMENAAVKALEGHLPEDQTTVGGRIDVQHLAATPVGMTVRARAELKTVEGRKLIFHIEAWDEVERIGEAIHERIVIKTEKFVARAQAKGARG
jgi:fluoroacetyl-CoA thioesterase